MAEAQSAGPANVDNLTFTNKWIYYDPTIYQNLEEFLNKYPPNHTGSAEKPSIISNDADTTEKIEPVWIYVGNPNATIEEGDIETAKNMWIELLNNPSVNLTYDTVKQIAEKTNVKMGKWNLEKVRSSKVNQYWNLIATATREGKLGIAAKVTTRFAAASKGYSIHIFTKNFMEEKDWMRIENYIREMKIVERIRYRPELYTHLGIYNDCIHLGIKPYLKQTGQRDVELEDEAVGKLPTTLDDDKPLVKTTSSVKHVRISQIYGVPLDPALRSHMQVDSESYQLSASSNQRQKSTDKPKSALSKKNRMSTSTTSSDTVIN